MNAQQKFFLKLLCYSLVADEILFNSFYNMNSFLAAIPSYFNVQPDFRPKNLLDKIKPKCRVLYFPILISPDLLELSANERGPVLHICWYLNFMLFFV